MNEIRQTALRIWTEARKERRELSFKKKSVKTGYGTMSAISRCSAGSEDSNSDSKSLVIVINQQTRNPARPSLTRICPCGSEKLYRKCCGTSGGSGILVKMDEAFCLATGGGSGQFVSVTPKSTDTPSRSTRNTSRLTETTGTQPGSIPEHYRTSTSSAEDSPARHSALLEKEGDLTTPGALSSLTSHGFSKRNGQGCSYWKTSRGCFLMTMGELSKPSSPRLLNWGMTSNGKCLTQKISAFPRTGKECSLSDILEEHPAPKYFLSAEMARRIIGQIGRSNLVGQPTQDTSRAKGRVT